MYCQTFPGPVWSLQLSHGGNVSPCLMCLTTSGCFTHWMVPVCGAFSPGLYVAMVPPADFPSRQFAPNLVALRTLNNTIWQRAAWSSWVRNTPMLTIRARYRHDLFVV